MRRTKKLLAGALALVLAFSLAGCGVLSKVTGTETSSSGGTTVMYVTSDGKLVSGTVSDEALAALREAMTNVKTVDMVDSAKKGNDILHDVTDKILNEIGDK